MRKMDQDDSMQWHKWFTAAVTPRIDAALRAFYEALDREITAGEATCWQSGACCRFDASFRNYVTGLEIAWFVAQMGEPLQVPDAVEPATRLPVLPSASGKPSPEGDPCPYQIDGLCSGHAVRPMGCRIYFCQPGTQQWQQHLYEHHLDALQALHEREGVTYSYMEWLTGLDAARQARAGHQATPAGPPACE